MTVQRFGLASLAAMALVTAACDSTENTEVEHTPDAATWAVDGVAQPGDTLVLQAGATQSVRLTFFEGADNLDDVESEHFSLLTFTPSTGIVATPDAGMHYTHSVDVQAGVAGTTGTLDIGFGHDAMADEETLHYAFKVE